MISLLDISLITIFILCSLSLIGMTLIACSILSAILLQPIFPGPAPTVKEHFIKFRDGIKKELHNENNGGYIP